MVTILQDESLGRWLLPVAVFLLGMIAKGLSDWLRLATFDRRRRRRRERLRRERFEEESRRAQMAVLERVEDCLLNFGTSLTQLSDVVFSCPDDDRSWSERINPQSESDGFDLRCDALSFYCSQVEGRALKTIVAAFAAACEAISLVQDAEEGKKRIARVQEELGRVKFALEAFRRRLE